MDRIPPHSIEAEQGVLGCILWEPNECLADCESKFADVGKAFYDLRHQAIYDAMRELADSMSPVNILSVQQHLKDKQMLEQVGGISYLSSLQDMVPSAANLEYYIGVVNEKAVLRRMIAACSEAIAKAYEQSGDPTELVDTVERDILAVRGNASSEEMTIKEAARQAIQSIEDAFNRGGAISGLSTGLQDLDQKTDGMHGGELIVLSAFPGVGKSALAMNIVEHTAIDNNLAVGVFSMEMSKVELVKRAMASRARVNLRERLSERDVPKLVTAAGKIARAPIFIDDSSDMTIGQIRAKARRLKQKHGIKLLVVDYIQIAAGETKQGGNREQEVASISTGLKQMARELDIPVIALSQLNDDGRVRESRKISQDADVMWKLIRPDQEYDPFSEKVQLLIEKQRSGDRGVLLDFVFMKQFTRFECAAKVSEEDIPKQKNR